MVDNCIFCKIADKEIESSIVYEDDTIFAFKDLDPQAPVHILFVPKKHIETLNDVAADDAAVLSKILLRIKKVAADFGIADSGYRIVINCNKGAGQEVFHLHVHLLGGRQFSWPPG